MDWATEGTKMINRAQLTQLKRAPPSLWFEHVHFHQRKQPVEMSRVKPRNEFSCQYKAPVLFYVGFTYIFHGLQQNRNIIFIHSRIDKTTDPAPDNAVWPHWGRRSEPETSQ